MRHWLLVSHDFDDGIWQLIGTSDADASTGKLGHLHRLTWWSGGHPPRTTHQGAA